MIPKGLFTQIIIYIVSGVIIYTYVHPTFTEVGEIQDQIQTYEEERAKVIVVNSKLADLVSKYERVSTRDRERLNIYMPDEIDEVDKLRDIYLITQISDAFYSNVSSGGDGNSQGRSSRSNQKTSDDSNLTPHDFALSASGEYDEIKSVLEMLQLNHYPLEVVQMDISSGSNDDSQDNPQEGDDSPLLSLDLTLRTYSIGEALNARE